MGLICVFSLKRGTAMNSERFTLRAICVFSSLICSLVFTPVSSAAIVTYNGLGSIESNASWDGGNRPVTVGDIGNIAVNGTQSGAQSYAASGGVMNQTAGILDFAGAAFNIHTNFTYNLSGGSMIDMFNVVVNGANMTFSMSGGSIDTGKFAPVNSGTFNMLAGNGTVVAVEQTGTGGTMDFQTGWTGSFKIGNYDAATWKDLFDSTGLNGVFATLDGSSLTSGEFDAAFQLTDSDTTISVIPEPSAFILISMGLIGLGLVLRRRR